MAAKPKPITYRAIDEETDGVVHATYEIMHELIGAFHPHLAQANIAIMWRYGWKRCRDGHLKGGEMRLCAEVDRELHGFDFVMALNYKLWSELDETCQVAIVDHELCHAQVDDDDDGDVRVDEKGRICYRIKKHDLEEFTAIVGRYGQYRQGVKDMIAKALEHADKPLLKAFDSSSEDDAGVTEAATA